MVDKNIKKVRYLRDFRTVVRLYSHHLAEKPEAGGTFVLPTPPTPLSLSALFQGYIIAKKPKKGFEITIGCLTQDLSHRMPHTTVIILAPLTKSHVSTRIFLLFKSFIGSSNIYFT